MFRRPGALRKLVRLPAFERQWSARVCHRSRGRATGACRI